ncbi:alpha/beta hydrolase [Streptomyces sp. DH37]|uniref:alpha/beta hydrolase n=1 Tax=Streptomyces sp. DH37 TaxID=3040122 RepID=UPI0024432F56|nr:alpha/beta hydrolase [Streptomyces sp. DH37]MDG9706447.1 alpha/beta hydrolase [Streptomyces sp. DH37]
MRSPHRFDPELAAALPLIPEVELLDVDAARASQAAQLAEVVAAADTAGVDVGEVRAPGPPGAPEVRLRLYRPRHARGPLPAVYGIHGGGFMLGSPDVDHDWNLLLCRELEALVVSVDYRLAPEHPFPAPLEDCYAGLRWLAGNARELEVRPDRIALWGDSAGAGLAAGLALLARDRGGPAVCFQHLCSPALDDRLRTPSARRFTDTPVWNRRNAAISWDAYLGHGVRGTAGVSPYAAPARAGVIELSGLPPAYVSVMEFDPLRDEGVDYARALLAAGVPVELHLIPGTFHGAWAVEHAAVIRRATAEAVAVLRGALGR